jgi:hypothetical protein
MMRMAAVWLAGVMGLGAETVLSVSLRGGSEVALPATQWAKGLSTRILSHAGVRLEWCAQPSRCQDWPGRIVISLEPRAPARLAPAALAEARVFEGRHIDVFLDRLNWGRNPQWSSRLLGHVIAHEIAHLLQGVDRHSEHGIMKAQWHNGDYAAMARSTIPFHADDLDLIQRGLEKRTSILAVPVQ